MTPEPARSDTSREAQAMRNLYYNLLQRADAGDFNREDALNLVMVCIRLGELGYTLTPDESDWTPAKGHADD